MDPHSLVRLSRFEFRVAWGMRHVQGAFLDKGIVQNVGDGLADTVVRKDESDAKAPRTRQG
eukprot:2756537-Rhodomonas_salina.1